MKFAVPALGKTGDDADSAIEIFTTRIDTIYGASALVLSPKHPLLAQLMEGSPNAAAVDAQWKQMRQTRISAADLANTEKEGFFTGRYAKNPFSGAEVPIWVANFVLAEYGTGAIMAVPAHDERDHEFATKYKLPIKSRHPAAYRRAYRSRGTRRRGRTPNTAASSIPARTPASPPKTLS